MAQRTKLTNALRGAAIGGVVGSVPSLCHLAYGLLIADPDPEWGKGAAVIGSLVLLGAVDIPAMVIGAIIGASRKTT